MDGDVCRRRATVRVSVKAARHWCRADTLTICGAVFRAEVSRSFESSDRSRDTVIDHETVTRTFPEGPGEIEIAAIYEVKDAKIVGAAFITGAMRLFGG